VGPTFANAKDEYLKKPRSRQLLNEVTLSWNFAESVIGNRPLANEPLAKFIDRVIFPPLEGASLSPSVKPEPA
jgi:hypothetical protein